MDFFLSNLEQFYCLWNFFLSSLDAFTDFNLEQSYRLWTSATTTTPHTREENSSLTFLFGVSILRYWEIILEGRGGDRVISFNTSSAFLVPCIRYSNLRVADWIPDTCDEMCLGFRP